MVTTATVTTALWVCVCLFVSRAAASHVPPKMSRAVQKLLQFYKIPVRERLNGRAVFSRELLTTDLQAKEVLMSAALQTYEKLIQRMLMELPAPTASPSPPSPTGVDVRAELSYVLKRVQELRRFRFQEPDALLEALERFRHIQMDNVVIQSKALWELPWLYEEAGSLAH
ncbi:interferon gamma-like [Dunckerocampus dactyliophorus]|uniref:interferon gamma-like n=1 Tax=Dunckerocampus dactyliophorus TaxID=161453 RepID=UPI002404CF30|nr:interferon gamma-like [Dunckerocampus dactyliophorus]